MEPAAMCGMTLLQITDGWKTWKNWLTAMYTRQLFNVILTTVNWPKLKVHLQQIIDDRWVATCNVKLNLMIVFYRFANTINQQQMLLNSQYFRKEMKLLKIFAIFIVTSAMFTNTIAIMATPNQFHLPSNFYVTFLPFPKPFSLFWVINYCLQTCCATFTIAFFLAWLPTLLFTLHHSAWLIDSALIEVNDKDVAFDIERLAKLVSKITVWQIRSQRLLQINFLIEFNFLAVILTLASFPLSNKVDDSISVVVVIMVMLMQLFLFCWFGSHVKDRLIQLTAALYNIEWYVLKTNQQKDLMLLILMARKIRTFHGVFKKVNLVTFKEVNSLRKNS